CCNCHIRHNIATSHHKKYRYNCYVYPTHQKISNILSNYRHNRHIHCIYHEISNIPLKNPATTVTIVTSIPFITISRIFFPKLCHNRHIRHIHHIHRKYSFQTTVPTVPIIPSITASQIFIPKTLSQPSQSTHPTHLSQNHKYSFQKPCPNR